jgi:high-affinity iron transporter
MLIVTGVLLAFVLVVMVGATVRTLQGAGWFPIHSIDVDLPYWLGTWLGVFPTWETLGAQVVAFAFVIGSYFAAEYVRVKRPRRRSSARAASAPGERQADLGLEAAGVAGPQRERAAVGVGDRADDGEA